MITVTPFENLGSFTNDWLEAHYHFSFASYRDPARRGLGDLLVWNDDTVRPGGGFATHGHEDMEIVTYVRRGAITHRDSLGNEGRTEAGDVQVMSAGTGIRHSEFNLEDAETTLFQIWITPDRSGHEPRWAARRFPKENRGGRFDVLASGRAVDKDTDALTIHQDAAVLGTTLKAGEVAVHDLPDGRRAYLVPAVGELEVNGVKAPARAGVEVAGEARITVKALSDAEVVLVDIA